MNRAAALQRQRPFSWMHALSLSRQLLEIIYLVPRMCRTMIINTVQTSGEHLRLIWLLAAFNLCINTVGATSKVLH